MAKRKKVTGQVIIGTHAPRRCGVCLVVSLILALWMGWSGWAYLNPTRSMVVGECVANGFMNGRNPMVDCNWAGAGVTAIPGRNVAFGDAAQWQQYPTGRDGAVPQGATFTCMIDTRGGALLSIFWLFDRKVYVERVHNCRRLS